MPGKRNYARERAAHVAQSPARQAALYQELRNQLPEHDAALIGYPTILAYLHRIGIRRMNHHRLTARIVQRWIRDHRCPILKGRWRPQVRSPSFTTRYALTAWLLSQLDTCELFSVDMTGGFTPGGSFTACSDAQRAA